MKRVHCEPCEFREQPVRPTQLGYCMSSKKPCSSVRQCIKRHNGGKRK